MQPRTKWLNTLGQALVLLGVVNFLLFWIIALSLGGDAYSGKIEDGRYFFKSNHRDPRYTEVTKAVWTYSKVHAISVWVTVPMAFAGAGMGALSKRRAAA
jgi:hypothetical protein